MSVDVGIPQTKQFWRKPRRKSLFPTWPLTVWHRNAHIERTTSNSISGKWKVILKEHVTLAIDSVGDARSFTSSYRIRFFSQKLLFSISAPRCRSHWSWVSISYKASTWATPCPVCSQRAGRVSSLRTERFIDFPEANSRILLCQYGRDMIRLTTFGLSGAMQLPLCLILPSITGSNA